MLVRLSLHPRQSWPDARLRQALTPFSRRVNLHYILETVRLALIWGLAAAAALLAFLHWSPFAAIGISAAGGGLAAVIICVWRWLGRPDALAVAVLADDLVLGGGAITAFRLLQRGPGVWGAWEQAALTEVLAGCASLGAYQYPVIPARSSWRGIPVLLGVFIGLALTPNPLLPLWEKRRAEQDALAVAAAEAARIVEPLSQLARGEELLLPEHLYYQSNRPLDSQLREAGSRQEGAAVLQQAIQELSRMAEELLPAGQEAAKLAALWQGQQGAPWQQLVRALEQGDADVARQAAADLWSQVSRLPPGSAASQAAALSFWRGAEAAGQPKLRQALREAAALVAADGSQGSEKDKSDWAAAGEALATALAELAAAAGQQAELTAAAGGLEQLAYGLVGGGGGMYLAGVAAGGGVSSADGGMMAGANRGDDLVANVPGQVGEPAAGWGSDVAQGGAGSLGAGGGSHGSGTGNGGNDLNGEGAGSGLGGDGSGQGSGSGAGIGGGGLEHIYAPFLPGGEGSATKVAAPIGAGEAGMEVSQPWSPAVLGAMRPYDQVYPAYAARARETIGRSPLPPLLENLVWQYFSAIEPEAGDN